jgi:hypothetical protein
MRSKTANRRGIRRTRIIVRRIMPEDFDFVQSLAASVAGYTVCPPYILWMLARAHSDFCAVALAPDGTRLGYLLVMSMDEPADAIFVWQLAVTFRGRRIGAQDRLAAHLRDALRDHGKTQMLFTTVPNSAAERSIRSLAKRVFGALPRMIGHLPDDISPREREYRLTLATHETKPRRA